MALSNKQMQGYFVFGGVAAIISAFILKMISQLVSAIPGVDLSLQSITVQTTGLGGIVGTGLGEFAKKFLGLVPVAISVPEWIFAFIGGGLFVLLGAVIVNNVKALQFAKTKAGKLATVFVMAGIVSGWILSMSIGLPALTGIIVMSVDAFILSWVLLMVFEAAWPKLVPV